MAARRGGRRGIVVVLAMVAATLVTPSARAAEATAPAEVDGRSLYDDAGALGGTFDETLERIADGIEAAHDIRVAVVAGPWAESDGVGRAASLADEVLGAWDEPRAVAVVVLADTEEPCGGDAAIRFTRGLDARNLDGASIVADNLRPAIDECDPAVGTMQALFGLTAALLSAPTAPAGPSTAGPPFPEPVVDRAVYDQAGVFEPETIESAETTIDNIEARTGAEVVVYTQIVGYGITEEEAESHAISLMDQWGIGRKGFDDGLVILFDLDPSLVHGQVQLYAGPGYRATFLTNDERQRVFEEDMLPLLRAEDLDGALLAGLAKVDANATPEHAARLQAARQVDAVLGLIGAPIVFLLLAGWGIFSWWRYGRDPVYLDSPSIHMPAPPPDLTAASAAFVMEGRATRRALTTALLDLASRGLLSFREEKAMLGLQTKVGIETEVPEADPVTEAHRTRNGRRPISKAEQYAINKLRSLAAAESGGYIGPDEVVKFGPSVSKFDERLEQHVVSQGWFAERPAKVTQRWVVRGILAIVAGGALMVLGFNLPSNGLLLIGGAAIAGGIVLLLIAGVMPAVTVAGAMIRAMLAAYRRTLEKTMAQARSMQQVVDEARLDWLETPDQAVVWGLALGLEDEVEKVLSRTLDDVKDGAGVASAYVPAWYHAGGASGGEARGVTGASGLMSSGSLPNLGGMMGALGTIGNSPSSSGSGGGGFSGGSSGGGGGGAGGGF